MVVIRSGRLVRASEVHLVEACAGRMIVEPVLVNQSGRLVKAGSP